jgi:hypothetical protein
MAASAFAATCAPAGSAGTAPPSWQTYCWIDMSSYNNATVFGGGQAFSVTLSDGSIFSFTINGSSPGTTTLQPRAAPAWTGAAVGNTAFLTIPGLPILYTATGGTVNLTISNIQITPPAGVVYSGEFKLVVADGESTNNGESLTYTTNGSAWTVIDQVNPISGSLYPTSVGAGTSTYSNGGIAGTVGAYIVGTQSPTTVTVQLVAGGLQGIMLAVQYSTISVNKVITGGRANPADQFTYGVRATSNSAVIKSATSTGTGNGPFGAAVATLSSGVSTTIFEEMAPGSVSNINQYTTNLNCTNDTGGSSTPLPNNQPVTTYVLGGTAYADSISCTYTNTPKPATVSLQKITNSAIGGTFTFTSTNLASNPPAITTSGTGTATPTSPTAINVTAYNTAVTITETPAANFTATSVTCTDANSAVTGNPATFGTLAGNVITIPAARVLAGARINCVLTNTLNATAPTVAIQKITLGAAGGPFTFSATNLSLTPAAISTAAASTAYPLTPVPIPVTTTGSAVAITETLATNFTINAASCVDTNAATSGNTTGTFGTLAGNVLTVPATNVRASARIVCTFTNFVNPAIPTVAVQKITTGAAGGAFTFAATNLTGALNSITTTAANTATPATTVPVTVTTSTAAVTITETVHSNFTFTTATCTDTNAGTSGNPTGTFGTLSGTTMTIPTANLRPFARIVCTYTNAVRLPTVQVQKTTTGAFGGPFNFTATNLASTLSSITTTAAGTATPVSPTAVSITAMGTPVTITEAANGSFDLASATCSDLNASFTGNPASFGTLASNVLTIPAANLLPAAQIRCVFTNTAKAATVAIRKTTTGTFGGPFNFSVANLGAAPAAITTTAAATPAPASPTALSVTSLNSLVQVSETNNPAYTFTSATCTDANAAVTGNPASFGTTTGLLLTIPAANILPGAQITCTFTNAGITATVAVQKITNTLAGGPFTFTQVNLASAPAAITTTAVGTATPASPTAIGVSAMNTQVQLTEVNSSFNLTSATCTDSNASVSGNTGSFGTVSGNTLTIPAANVVSAARIRCTFTNTPRPATVAVQKITIGNAGGPFNFAATNLASAISPISTSAASAATPSTPTPINVTNFGSPVQITESYTLNFSTTSATCSDSNSAVTGNPASFGTRVGNVLTVPAANILPAAQINCVFTNTGNAPTISLQKALAASGRLAAADQFRLQATGTGAPAAVTTTGTGAAITSAAMSFTGTANTAYSLTETMAPGSSSLLIGYVQSVVCTNTNVVGTNVSTLTTIPINFTARAGDAISCTITNNGTATPGLSVTKTYVAAPTPVALNQTVTYTYTVANTGNVAITNVRVTDMHGTPAVQIPWGAGGITGDTLSIPGPLGAAASPDTTANDGTWSTLAPGATVTFTYTHTVTVAEMNQG